MSDSVSRRVLLRALGGAAAAVLTAGDGSWAQELPMATPQALGPALPPELADYAADWPTAQGSLAGRRAAAASPIDAGSVERLAVAWRFPLTAMGGYGAMTANPLVVGDTVYVQDMECSIFALDRESGTVRWQRDYGVPTAGANGVAAGYGLLFASIGLQAETVALDAATGEEIWRTKLSANPNEFIFMQPVVYDSVVYIATSPAAYVGGTRGILFALDAQSGAVLWQWDTTAGNLWGSARVNAGGGSGTRHRSTSGGTSTSAPVIPRPGPSSA